MNNQLILVKAKQRLNKKASFDFDNIEDWEIIEAFNKVQVEFVRRGAKQGEDTKQDLDDLQVVLQTVPLKGTNLPKYFQTTMLPDDYLSYKRISFEGSTPTCTDKRAFVVYLGEEANKDIYNADANRKPSFEWAETYTTILSNRIHIHTNGEFMVSNPTLTYYRRPKDIQIVGVVNPATGIESTREQTCEFKDDIIELLIDEAVMVLAGDIESPFQVQRAAQSITRNEP